MTDNLTNNGFEKLSNFISELSSGFDLAVKSGGHLALCNSGRRGEVKEFNLGIPEVIETLEDMLGSNAEFARSTHYEEKTWRDLGGQNFSNRTAASLITVQTKPVFTTLSKLIHWANDKQPSSYTEGHIDLSEEAIKVTIQKLRDIEVECAPTNNETELNSIDLAELLNKHESPIIQLYKSLLTKPFSILTGASGTGKTKLATALASYLSNSDNSNSATIAVGADWTDNRSVLGFVNHLRPLSKDGVERPSYQSTAILDLILRANQASEYPHFLILDEMNLSHVERYFSDFLSVMEQSNGELGLHKEGDCNLLRFEGDETGVPAKLPYPKNLFVIGTVNIDETTYMFSPKVLDRANVIEFTVSKTEIGDFLNDPQPYQEIETAEPGVAEGFLRLAQQAQNSELDALPPTSAEPIAAHLLNLFKILKAGRFEFAYRTAKEVNTYLRVCRHLADDSSAWDDGLWKPDLDDQVLQKLLPKLHGSMGRIGCLLAELAAYCHTGTYTERSENDPGIPLKTALALEKTDTPSFPQSLAKLQSMIRTLQDEQFVSFIQ